MIRPIAALALGFATPAIAQAQRQAPVDYRDDASWLCLPGRADPCGRPLPTVALNPNGYGSLGEVRPAEDPPIDCFYVYPTVSRDPGLNSDMNAGPEEAGTAMVQFARFSTVCRTFAPIYRQGTLAAIPRSLAGEDMDPVFGRAYADILAAWRNYLRHRNRGRPVVLIGHSQGTILLTRLIAEEIENRPARSRFLSALLIGFTIEVPQGRVVGGTFRRTPLCTRLGQARCIVTYASFRAANPPPPGAIFGRATRSGMTAACTNPAALGGGSAPLDSYWYTAGSPIGSAPITWSSEGPPPAAFARTEGLVSAACVHDGPVGYLAVTVHADPADPRTDQIPGDVAFAGQVQAGWGLHLADMNLAMGDLLRVVEAQSAMIRRR